MASELTGILQIAIPAKDIERAAAFYGETLGLQPLMKAPGMAFFDCGGVRLYVDANMGAAAPAGNTMIYFRATDIERAHATFQARGVTIHQPPQVIARLPDRDVWLMWIRDSESNLLGVMQEKAKKE